MIKKWIEYIDEVSITEGITLLMGYKNGSKHC